MRTKCQLQAARGETIWTYDGLRDASDIVAVIEPIKTENNDAKLAGWDEISSQMVPRA